MAKATITGNKAYLKWLIKHLAKEHPKTKGRITYRK